MKTGSVPSSWLSLTGNWTATAQLALLTEVNRRGIAHDDLTAVAAVWKELKAWIEAEEQR